MNRELVAPWPAFTQEEADAVADVLLSNKVNYWTGTKSRDFEQAFAAFCDCSHAIAVGNGTLALDLALYGLGIGDRNGGSCDDEVIVTPRGFMASVSAIVNAGACPVFADVDRDSQNITPITVGPVVTSRTRAILCVHLAGWPCDMDGFRDLIGTTDIKLIEDCAQAHGARHKGRPVGGLGDIAAWSFCQDKIMTTGGEGGMVTCNDAALWRRMWSFKDHGRDWEATFNRQHPPGFRWQLDSFGTNWRLTEMQSAIGLIQLSRMARWHRERQENAAALTDALTPYSGINGLVRLPQIDPSEGSQHAYYKFYAFLRLDRLAPNWSLDRFIAAINDRGIPCFHGACPEIYREKAFDSTDFRPQDRLANAQELGETNFMMMVHPTLTQQDMANCADVLRDICALASGQRTV
ncbi:DegT/DnrJ/EryC1/StrS aminotransferase family protein [Yoonia sp.]|uniref:DegT/DnrJ/EryC1/StrS family aminotransferase n=1 Tax=Yoonia sp. TaxID=2212373 RepID=UPI0025D7AF32|nr:DegT/DnrJ/EryC1/StrS aminotransferase family protein [Yoonia sp.]